MHERSPKQNVQFAVCIRRQNNNTHWNGTPATAKHMGMEIFGNCLGRGATSFPAVRLFGRNSLQCFGRAGVSVTEARRGWCGITAEQGQRWFDRTWQGWWTFGVLLCTFPHRIRNRAQCARRFVLTRCSTSRFYGILLHTSMPPSSPTPSPRTHPPFRSF